MSEQHPRTLPAGIEIYPPTSEEDFVAMAELGRVTVLDDAEKRGVAWHDLLSRHDSEWAKIHRGYYRARTERAADQYSTRLARIGEAIVGMCHVQNIGGRGTRREVLEHGVDPDHQGLGVGTALLVASLDEASPDAIVELRVAEKSPAAAYYRRRGFELDSARSGHVFYYDKNDPSRKYCDPFVRLTTTAGALAEHALRAVDLGAVLATED